MSRILDRFFGAGRGSHDLAPVALLLRKHGLRALDKQLHLNDLLDEADWLLDQDAGTITFGGEVVCTAQVLGTQSDSDRMWLWAWANPSVPEAVRRDAELLRGYGERHGIPLFSEAEQRIVGSMPPEMLALVASELTDADGYYRGPYEGGAVFVLLRLPPDAARPALGDVRRVVRTLGLAPMVLTVGIDREAVEVYLASSSLEVVGEADELTGRDADGDSVTVRFDRSGRIRDISTTLTPDEAPPPR